MLAADAVYSHWEIERAAKYQELSMLSQAAEEVRMDAALLGMIWTLQMKRF